jgi:hypothetical protein
MLWDTSCPRDWEERWVPTGLHEFFPYDRVTEEQYLDQRLAQLGLGPESLDFVVSPTGPPATPAAIVNDLSQWYASVEKLRGIAEQSNAKVIFGHDAEQLWSLRRSPDGHYT